MKNILNNKIHYIYIFYFLFYLSLIAGIFYGENPSGGGKKDYLLLHVHLIETGFKNGVIHYLFHFFPNGTLNHSPIYYIIIYFLQNLFNNEISRLILLHLFLIVPFYFYKSLVLENKNNKFLYLLIPIVFFISPNLRSVVLWSGREILSLSFLCISIFYFLNFKKSRKVNFIYYSFLFLVLGSYISPEIGIISLIYLYHVFKILNLRQFFILIFNLIILSIPFFYYIIFYYSENEFNNPIFFNLYKNLSTFFSAIFLVTIPFIIFKNFKNYLLFIKTNKYLIILILILTYFFLNSPYQYDFGGGVVLRLLMAFNLEEFIFFFSFLGILNISYLIKEKLYYNLFILFIFVLQTCLNLHFFQKYIDISYLFYFVFLFDSKPLKECFNNNNFVILFIIFNCLYYTGSVLYRLI